MTIVRLPPVLRPEVGGARQVEIEAVTIRSALEQLVSEYPSLEGRVMDGDDVPPFLNVFVDGENMRVLEGLETAVGEQTTILLLPAVAGG